MKDLNDPERRKFELASNEESSVVETWYKHQRDLLHTKVMASSDQLLHTRYEDEVVRPEEVWFLKRSHHRLTKEKRSAFSRGYILLPHSSKILSGTIDFTAETRNGARVPTCSPIPQQPKGNSPQPQGRESPPVLFPWHLSRGHHPTS